jgi:hypothetical protein
MTTSAVVMFIVSRIMAKPLILAGGITITCAFACPRHGAAESEVGGTAFADHERVHIPEPMIFDLVRGLGARRGEFESNILAQFPLNHTGSRHVEWAPEIEYAIRDGLALEFELPFEDDRLEAYKLAAQLTFDQPAGRFLHGTQVIAEKTAGKDIWELTALYVPGFRFDDRWSVLAMVGVRRETGDDADQHETILLNASLFMDLNRATSLGLETNFADGHGNRNHSKTLVMPQVHHEITDEWTIQAGVGAEFSGGRSDATGALRLIWSRAP